MLYLCVVFSLKTSLRTFGQKNRHNDIQQQPASRSDHKGPNDPYNGGVDVEVFRQTSTDPFDHYIGIGFIQLFHSRSLLYSIYILVWICCNHHPFQLCREFFRVTVEHFHSFALWVSTTLHSIYIQYYSPSKMPGI